MSRVLGTRSCGHSDQLPGALGEVADEYKDNALQGRKTMTDATFVTRPVQMRLGGRGHAEGTRWQKNTSAAQRRMLTFRWSVLARCGCLSRIRWMIQEGGKGGSREVTSRDDDPVTVEEDGLVSLCSTIEVPVQWPTFGREQPGARSSARNTSGLWSRGFASTHSVLRMLRPRVEGSREQRRFGIRSSGREAAR